MAHISIILPELSSCGFFCGAYCCYCFGKHLYVPSSMTSVTLCFNGGFRVLGKGVNKKNRDDCACYRTIHGPSARGCDALGVAGGWFWGGCPPFTIRKIEIRKTLDVLNLVTHGSQIYCLLFKSMFLSTSRSYQITSFTLPISTRCQV